jgi:outer membrane protein TolC
MDSLKNSILFLLILVASFTAKAQSDSTRLLTKDAFLAIVRAYHPVVKSAALQVARAKAGIQQARGAFDPTIDAGLSSKTLDGKAYYQYFNPQITIPTWYGLELIGGVEDVRGERVSPEATTGALSYAGAKLNLSGILLDNRRAILQQAKSIALQSEAERRLAVNNLIYEALGTYYNWQREWNALGIINEALDNARERYRFVQVEWEGGARPAIDTVEALTQLQAIELQQSATALAYANATLDLSNYLWLESGQPVPLIMAIRPTETFNPLALPLLEELLNTANTHPKLETLRSKQSVLDVERRLKGTYLLPKVSVKATTLSKGYSTPSEGNTAYLENNNKVAAEIRLPLFLREARGAYRAAGLKQQEIGLEIDATTLAIENNIRAAYNEVSALSTQLRIAESILSNYQRLYSGERLKFEAGESTLFILNSRQNKVIEGAQKVVDLTAKLRKAEVGLYYAGGVLE